MSDTNFASHVSTLIGGTTDSFLVGAGTTSVIAQKTAAQVRTLLDVLTSSQIAAAYQPLDSDLTSIAALTTTSFGRGLLTESSASTARTTLGLGTLATQNGTISDYLTIASAASTYIPLTRTLNTLALSADQTFATGTSGTDFAISSSGTTHTFNIPDASAANRGLVTTGTQTFAGVKTFTSNPSITLSSVVLRLDATSSTGLSSVGFYDNGTFRGYLGWMNSGAARPNRMEFYSLSGTQPIAFLVGSTTARMEIDASGVYSVVPYHLTNSYVSSTNFERCSLSVVANEFLFASTVGSAGGSNRPIKLGHTNSGGTFTAAMTLNTAGTVTIGAYTLPATDGTNGYVLTTNGAGTVTWAAGGGGGGISAAEAIYYAIALGGM